MRRTITGLVLACLFYTWIVVPVAAVDAGWQPVVATEAVATIGGFGNADNLGIDSMAVYKGYLYAGCTNFEDGVQIWRSLDGANWTPVVGPSPVAVASGFDYGNEATNIGELIVFNNGIEETLYCGFSRLGGCEVWSSTNGISWTQVVGGGTPPDTDAPGFGSVQNGAISGMAVFAGRLWAATFNTVTGTQVFSSSNGSDWVLELDNGFGDDNNVAAYCAKVFNSAVYVGLLNIFPARGCAVVTSTDGNTWDYSVGNGQADPPGITPNGFYADSDNVAVAALEVFKGQLYAGTVNLQPATTELWRTSDGVNWAGASLNGYGLENSESTNDLLADPTDSYLLAATGLGNAGVFGSTNGLNWTQLNLPGFSPENNNTSVTKLIWFNGYLYAATSNGTQQILTGNSAQALEGYGAEVWRINDDALRTSLGLMGQPELPYTGEAKAAQSSEGEASHAPNPVKDFSIVFAIAIAAVVVGFIAFKSARKGVKK